MAESTAVVTGETRSLAHARLIVTQDDCVNIAKEVADGAFHKLPLLAHALVQHLCDDMPQDASVHEATQHIAMRGVGVLQRLPIEATASEAAESVHRVFVLGAALCGVGFVYRIASSASVLLILYNRLGPGSLEKKCMSSATFAWIALCAWRSTSTYSKVDASLALIALMFW